MISWSPVWYFFWGGSVPYGNSRLIVMKGKSPTANQSYGAMECTVNGHYSNTTVMYKEKILHVTILDICRSVPTGVFFFFFFFFSSVFDFLPVQIDTHAGLKGQEVTCSLLPLDYWPRGPVFQWRGRVIQSAVAVVVVVAFFLGNVDAAFFLKHVLHFSFSCWIASPQKKKKKRQSF